MKDKCFNIYYLNLNKVYELSMMINNTILTCIKKENNNINKFTKNKKASFGGTLQADSEYLASIKSVIESNRTSERTTSYKIIENLDIKTTKSILLNKIKSKCIDNTKINEFNEGDLIKLNNVKLSILDRETLQQMLLLKRDALKGLKVEGIEINNIISSMIKDYSYVLIGTINESQDQNKFIIKIPFEIENEFENNYNVDDILLGNVSLIGIYKSKNKLSEITNNTLNYFIKNEKKDNIDSEKFIKSNEETKKSNINNLNYNEEYNYVDIIAIIQEIKFKDEERQPKLPWYKKIFHFKKGIKNEN